MRHNRRSGSEEEQYRILRPHLKHWQPRQWRRANSSLPPDAAYPDPYSQAGRRSALVTSIHPAAATAVRIPAFRPDMPASAPGVGKTTVTPTQPRRATPYGARQVTVSVTFGDRWPRIFGAIWQER